MFTGLTLFLITSLGGHHTWFVNAEVFDFIKDQRVEDFGELEHPTEDVSEWLYANNIEVEFPYILYDELTLYG